MLALQGVAPAGAADALAGRLEDPAQQVRQAAARALAARGDTRGVPVLLAALRTAEHDTDPVEALGMGKDARAVEPLIGLLDAGEDQMRVAAAAALGRIGDRRAEAPLRALSHHCSAEVRRAAAAALAALGCPAEAFPSPARQ